MTPSPRPRLRVLPGLPRPGVSACAQAAIEDVIDHAQEVGMCQYGTGAEARCAPVASHIEAALRRLQGMVADLDLVGDLADDRAAELVRTAGHLRRALTALREVWR